MLFLIFFRSKSMLRRRKTCSRNVELRVHASGRSFDPHRQDIQHLRSSHAHERWQSRVEFYFASSSKRLNHDLWQRQTNKIVPVCVRFGRRPDCSHGFELYFACKYRKSWWIHNWRFKQFRIFKKNPRKECSFQI